MISRIKGTRDFVDLTLFNFIVKQASEHVQLYGFNQIMTPILEPVELFKRALGQHTDVVSKEMYLVHAGGEVQDICLRPEATASTARAFVENHIEQIPWNVFSWGPMFRHERPQKGRYRQFYQFNIEMVGAESVAYDVHFIKMLDRLFCDRFKLANYAVKINFLGCAADREQFKTVLNSFLDKHIETICKTCRERKDKNILRIFDCKNETCSQLYQSAPKLTNHLCDSCTTEWQQLQDQLSLTSVSWVHDPTLVRGLDYYNKTVFEFVSDNLGAQNAFCAGGRYGHLIEYAGGKPDQPCIGAAMGIGRLLLLLEPTQESLALPQKPALHVVIPMDAAQHSLALLVADMLIVNKLATEIFFDGSLKSRMRKANKYGAKYVLLIGPDEQIVKQVTLKNMATGQEQRIDQTELARVLKGA